MPLTPQPNFDPFSPKTLERIQKVEHLPDSRAFENAMFEHRTQRIAHYRYERLKETDEDGKDLNPLVMDERAMLMHFPEDLKPSFPELTYGIEELEINLIDFPDDTSTLTVNFFANGTPHTFKGLIDGAKTSATHNTFDADLHPVEYTVNYESVIGLMAAFLYQRQIDGSTRVPEIDLDDSVIVSPRHPSLELGEQIITTLGDYSGRSLVETTALFGDGAHDPMLATLREWEFKDKSSKQSRLSLTEFNDISATLETSLNGSYVDIEEDKTLIPAGRIDVHYVDEKLTDLTTMDSIEQRIDSQEDHVHWAKTCTKFLKLIKKPMKPYAHLDDGVEY